MLGKKPNWYWKIMWMFVTPALTLIIILASFYGLASDGITYIRWNPELVRNTSLFILQ